MFWVLILYPEAGMVRKMNCYRIIGLQSTFWVYVLPGAINAIYLVIMRTYMEHLLSESDEAAVLDDAYTGSNQRLVLFCILCIPILTFSLFYRKYYMSDVKIGEVKR